MKSLDLNRATQKIHVIKSIVQFETLLDKCVWLAFCYLCNRLYDLKCTANVCVSSQILCLKRKWFFLHKGFSRKHFIPQTLSPICAKDMIRAIVISIAFSLRIKWEYEKLEQMRMKYALKCTRCSRYHAMANNQF